MRLVIIEVPYKDNSNDFDFKKSKFIDFCDESNYVRKCKELLPKYKSRKIMNDFEWMVTGCKGHRRLCPNNNYYLFDLSWMRYGEEGYQNHSEALSSLQEQLRILKINSVMD